MSPSITSAVNTSIAVVVGTGGHIDHGKTSLVLALTGTDTDRLPEEKRRGITIDLGFAALTLNGPAGERIEISLVDVPGHHGFLQNMMAGAGGVDSALLVIAADEGVRAQTRQHLAIFHLLGVERCLVALTKKDAVSAERLAQAQAEAQAFLQGTPYAGSIIVPVSARNGEGLDELKGELARMALQRPARSNLSVLRLPIDRAFSIAGFGTVVTGTLHKGSLRTGETLVLQPTSRPVRVRGLQVHRLSVSDAQAATRVAVNLAGVEVAQVRRGDMLVQADNVEPTRVLDVELVSVPGAPPFRHRSLVNVHAFAAESPARLLLYSHDVSSGGRRLARLRLDKPMTLVPHDRFVLRQPSPVDVLGGGRVLDAHPDLKIRKLATQRWLEEMRGRPPQDQVPARVRRKKAHGITAGLLVRETGLTMPAIEAVAAMLSREGKLVVVNGGQGEGARYLDPDAVGAAAQRLLRELESLPLKSGLRAELVSRTKLAQWVFDLAVEHLRKAQRVQVAGNQLQLAGLALPGQNSEASQLARIEELYRSAGLAAPIVSEAAAKLKMEQKELTASLTLLLRAGKLVRMGEDRLLVHADALAKLKRDLETLRGQTLDVTQFKHITGLTRKHVIPLLEYLDSKRITINRQGVRTIL